MKRMYGNQRHYNVLRSELVNEMFEEMFDEMPKRQHHRSHPPPSPSVSSSPSSSPSGSRTARYHTVSSVNSLNAKNIAKSGKANAAASSERHQKSRSMKVTTEPEYRRPQTTSSTSKPKFQEKSTGNKLKTGPHLSFHASNRPQLPSENSKNEVRRTNTRRPQQPSTTDTTSPSSGVITTSLEDAPTSTSEEQWLDPDEDYLSFENAEETLMEDDIHSTFFPPPSLDGDIELFEEDYWTTVDDIFTDSTTPYTSTHHDDIVDTFSTVPLPEVIKS
ncbi:hypothetical protein SK128_004934 [Halocaridina rubra]|uniref:Uncharacterized protein n=1 Tax=Halocaridina rubra TaxID=373956 RepID=A0AAN8WAI5_HALRR